MHKVRLSNLGPTTHTLFFAQRFALGLLLGFGLRLSCLELLFFGHRLMLSRSFALGNRFAIHPNGSGTHSGLCH